MVTAVRSSRPGKRSRLQPSSPRANKHRKRRRCASHVTRSPSPSRDGRSVTAPTTRSTGTTTCWPQGSCQSLRTTHGPELNEPTNQSRIVASGERTPEAASTHVHRCLLTLCLRLVVAITNYERGDSPGSDHHGVRTLL